MSHCQLRVTTRESDGSMPCANHAECKCRLLSCRNLARKTICVIAVGAPTKIHFPFMWHSLSYAIQLWQNNVCEFIDTGPGIMPNLARCWFNSLRNRVCKWLRKNRTILVCTDIYFWSPIESILVFFVPCPTSVRAGDCVVRKLPDILLTGDHIACCASQPLTVTSFSQCLSATHWVLAGFPLRVDSNPNNLESPSSPLLCWHSAWPVCCDGL